MLYIICIQYEELYKICKVLDKNNRGILRRECE